MSEQPEIPLARLLRQGIAAARSGRRDQARALLEEVIARDPDTLSAWLWLSGVVDTREERRICLENVLTLDPAHALAQKGLTRLDQTAPAAAPAPDAAAPPAISYQSESSFDDVWAGDAPLCAFCAAEVEDETTRCPGCGRDLVRWVLAYPRPSSTLYVLLSLLLGALQLLALQTFARYALGTVPAAAFVALVFFLLLIVLCVGIVRRDTWAHIGGLILLPLLLVYDLLLAPRWGTVGNGVPLPLSEPLLALLASSGAVVDLLYRAALGLGFAVSLLLVQPDFARRPVYLLARVERRLKSASSFFQAGKTYARRGMWATAVVHWQRAAANDPLRAGYQEALGDAYARLGFHERSRDALQSALRLAVVPAQRERIAERLAAVAATRAAGSD